MTAQIRQEKKAAKPPPTPLCDDFTKTKGMNTDPCATTAVFRCKSFAGASRRFKLELQPLPEKRLRHEFCNEVFSSVYYLNLEQPFVTALQKLYQNESFWESIVLKAHSYFRS